MGVPIRLHFTFILLLIFLIVTSTFKQQPSLRLEVPESTQAQKSGASETAPLVVSVDAQGNVLTTSFTAAWRNGFDHSLGSVNLANAYRPSSNLDLHDGQAREHYMAHSPSDVRCNEPATPKMCQYRNPANTQWINSTQACAGNSARGCAAAEGWSQWNRSPGESGWRPSWSSSKRAQVKLVL